MTVPCEKCTFTPLWSPLLCTVTVNGAAGHNRGGVRREAALREEGHKAGLLTVLLTYRVFVSSHAWSGEEGDFLKGDHPKNWRVPSQELDSRWYFSTWAVTRWRSWLVRRWVLCSTVWVVCTPFYRRDSLLSFSRLRRFLGVLCEHRLTYFLLSPHSAGVIDTLGRIPVSRQKQVRLTGQFILIDCEGRVKTPFSSERQSPVSRIFIDFLLFRHSAAVTVSVLDIPVSPETGALDSTARVTAQSFLCLLFDKSIPLRRPVALHSTMGHQCLHRQAHQVTDYQQQLPEPKQSSSSVLASARITTKFH